MDIKIKQIAEHYGFDNQSMIAIEEMSELTKALCKLRRLGDEPLDEPLVRNVTEEIADVMIMLQQLIYLTGNDIEVQNIMEQKLKRQIRRMEGEET